MIHYVTDDLAEQKFCPHLAAAVLRGKKSPADTLEKEDDRTAWTKSPHTQSWGNNAGL